MNWSQMHARVVPSTVVVCPYLRQPDNSVMNYSKESHVYQSLARYVCASGYMLDGDESRECRADGTWNGSSPICRRKPPWQ